MFLVDQEFKQLRLIKDGSDISFLVEGDDSFVGCMKMLESGDDLWNAVSPPPHIVLIMMRPVKSRVKDSWYISFMHLLKFFKELMIK